MSIWKIKEWFSLQSIKMILNDILSDYESDIVISLFFDRAIDEGIVVPTIYHNTKNKYLCRAYRHGEDLPFGIEDECRLLFFLKKLMSLFLILNILFLMKIPKVYLRYRLKK